MRYYFAAAFTKLPWGCLRHKNVVFNTYSKLRYLKTTANNIDKRSFDNNQEIQEYLTHILQQHSDLTKTLTSSGNEMTAEKRRATGKTLSKYSPLVKIIKRIDKKQKRKDQIMAAPNDEMLDLANEIKEVITAQLTEIMSSVGSCDTDDLTEALEEELVELQILLKEGEEEMRELVKEESLKYEEELEKLKESLFRNLVPQDDEDNNDAILEVRAGTGGQEACLFTMEVFQMYQKFSSFKSWKFSPIRVNKSESGGFKEASASISGDGVFGALKHEIGVHRVQRVPATEAMGRLHTSTMTVAVLPEPEEIDVTLNQQDLKIDTFRASGAGGQHVNTTDSAVRITHLPSRIVVANQDERSQIKNKQKALRVLRAKLFQLQRETADKERSLTRRQQIGTGERSEKIRTYNFPQNRVTDHRVGVSSTNIEEFLKGEQELQDMVDILQTHYQTMALEQILQGYRMK